MEDRYTQKLIERANKYGLEGKKIIGWIRPLDATDNPDGPFVMGFKEIEVKDAGDK